SDLVQKDECQVRVELSGTNDVGQTVRAYLALDVRVPPEVKPDSGKYGRVRIEDSKMAAKIARATKLLGRDRITPADIERLEKQGRLYPCVFLRAPGGRGIKILVHGR